MEMQLVSKDFCLQMEFGSQKSPIQSVHMIHVCLDMHRNPIAVSGFGHWCWCGGTPVAEAAALNLQSSPSFLRRWEDFRFLNEIEPRKL